MSRMDPALLRRFGERGRYELADAQAVFDDAFIAHVSYIDDGFPACQPMIALIREEHEAGEAGGAGETQTEGVEGAVTGEAGSETQREGATTAYVYLHGHPTTRLMQIVQAASKAEDAANEAREAAREAGTAESDLPPAFGPAQRPKVCITATKIDGLVLSTAPNGHTFNYRCATVHGTCEAVRGDSAAGKALKRAIMHEVTDRIVAGRVREVNPVASLAVGLVYVVRVAIDRLSVKTRKGPPGIQPRNPAKDGPDVVPPAWAGTVPMWEHLGAPIESGLTPAATVPASLHAFIAARNAKHEAHAKHAAS